MKILIDIGHPAHVHLFKNVICNLTNSGHEIKITTRDKDITLALLRAFHFQFECIGKNFTGLLNKGVGMIRNDIKILRIARRFKPDLFISVASPYAAQISWVIRKPHILFTDSEPTALINNMAFPFSYLICTPASYKRIINKKKHLKYNGYHELAYLHPKYIKPDRSILDELNVNKNEKFAILRFVAWNASHDVGHEGFNIAAKRTLVKELSKRCKVFITAESELPADLEKYRISIPPQRIHDALYFADLLVGDSQTMTTEAAVLGTPAVRCNSMMGTMGNFDELEEKYDLIYSFKDSDQAIAKALELIDSKDLKKKWHEKRDRLLKEKIDVTEFITKLIENFPNSGYEIK